MTRTFWVILALIVAVVGGFASVVTVGGGESRRMAWRKPFSASGRMPATDATLVVPVEGIARRAIADSWGDPRGGGMRSHHGTDIMAPGGTPVVAAAGGRIEKLFQSRLGGVTLYIRSPDRAWVYYYAHLARYADGIREGLAVEAGDRIGYVGDTGDAGAGNYHLHFGVTRMRPGDRWWQGENVNPYPMLAGKAADR